MRKVAGYALFSGSLDSVELLSRFQAICDLVSAWLEGKGAWRSDGDKQELVFHDGRVAEYSHAEWAAGNKRVIDHRLTEPANNALIRTQVSIAATEDQVIVYVELQAAGGAYQLGPMRVDIRCPQLVKTLVARFGDWHVGEAPLSIEPFDFAGAEGGRRLEDVIWHPKRNLPVVLLAPYEGRYLTDVFPRDIASDLVGVALVGTVDAEASWELTTRRGKEWSCFNGAVRLYWPGLDGASKPVHNPLWTRLTILSHVPTVEDAASRFKRQLRRLLLGLSAFAMPEPVVLAMVRKTHTDNAAEAARATFRADDDWQGLANSYSEENEQLRNERDELAGQVRDLEAQVANLQLSLQWKAPEGADFEPDATLPPSTVEEAVSAAMERFDEQLIFGDQVKDGIRSVAADAGPPDKVLAYLGHLDAMVRARRNGSLGTTAIKWLQSQGINASGESETIKNSADEQRKRTWHDGSGRRAFDLHLKPTDGTHPDRCVRIYFEYDDSLGKAIIGWVGRHP